MLPGLRADPAKTSLIETSPVQALAVQANAVATNALRGLSPAEVVASRFEANAIAVDTRTQSQPQGGGGFALASASEVPQNLDPNPVYSRPSPQPAVERVASAAPEEPPPPPVKKAAPRPAPVSHTVLNNAQIASIRDRLKLSAYQDQLWPPVESALRDIDLRKDPKAKAAGKAEARVASIDPNSPQVQRLKSAAVPLIMSFNDDQKQEVRTLLRLMGLENLATQF